MRYRVLSDNCTLAKKGGTVDDPEGVNVAALIAGGHLEVVRPVKKTKAAD
jgi:GTP-dependent phosphoenolpyruvate carboxykinase